MTKHYSQTVDLPRLILILKQHLADRQPLTIAIDGRCGGGKTTLAAELQAHFSAAMIHADDFFLRPEQRTPERFAEIGGNFDRERFQGEVLQSLINNENVTYRRFNCSTQTLEAPITVFPKKITVVEGAYSMHPSLGSYYDIAVLLDIEPEYQRERILIRNSKELAERFFNEWIPLENRYFEATDIKNRADMIFRIYKN